MESLFPLCLKLIKFGLVGVMGTTIDFSITWLLKEKCGLNKYVANSCGFSIAVINNYFWNRYWTFECTTGDMTTQFATFAAIAAMGLVIDNTTIYLLSRKLKWNFYILKAMATVIVAMWNFVMNLLITFA